MYQFYGTSVSLANVPGVHWSDDSGYRVLLPSRRRCINLGNHSPIEDLRRCTPSLATVQATRIVACGSEWPGVLAVCWR